MLRLGSVMVSTGVHVVCVCVCVCARVHAEAGEHLRVRVWVSLQGNSSVTDETDHCVCTAACLWVCTRGCVLANFKEKYTRNECLLYTATVPDVGFTIVS